MGTEQASSVDEVISRSQGGAGVAPPASPGLLTINDLNARRSSNADGSESAASSSRSRPESPRTAGAAPALHTVALDLRSLLETHIASVLLYVLNVCLHKPSADNKTFPKGCYN